MKKQKQNTDKHTALCLKYKKLFRNLNHYYDCWNNRTDKLIGTDIQEELAILKSDWENTKDKTLKTINLSKTNGILKRNHDLFNEGDIEVKKVYTIRQNIVVVLKLVI